MFHVIRSADRISGVPEQFIFELTHPINDIVSIELIEANIPTHATDYYHIKVSQLHNQVMNHNGFTNYSTFIVPHHHAGVPGSNTEYTKNHEFEQIITMDRISVNVLNIQLCGDNGQPIAGASEWSMILKITQSH